MDLSAYPIFDQHAHNLLKPEAAMPFAAAFTEGRDTECLVQARDTLFYRRSLRDIARLLDCAPLEPSIVAARTQLGLEALTARCFQAAQLQGVLLDDGFLPEQILPLDWHRQFLPVARLLRLEALAQELFGASADFDGFMASFRAALDPIPSGVAGFKSIAAYRSGLAIQPVERATAAERFAVLKSTQGDRALRLADKPLLDFLLTEALLIAAKHRLPVQFHTGFGDPDLDLRLANPLHLRCLLEDPRFRPVPFVLLHTSYPFAREAGFLAAVYPHVHLDMGLAVPFLSVAGMRQSVQMLLELAPTSKLLYSSDAHLIPEPYFLAAKWGRVILGEVLEGAVSDGDLTANEAEECAAAILAGNAQALYRI